MKMSDVTFNTRMTEGGPNIDATLTFIGAESVNAAAHAVYRFDTLTQVTQELVEALECLELAVSCDREAFGSPAHQNARVLLKRAKELAE